MKIEQEYTHHLTHITESIKSEHKILEHEIYVRAVCKALEAEILAHMNPHERISFSARYRLKHRG